MRQKVSVSPWTLLLPLVLGCLGVARGPAGASLEGEALSVPAAIERSLPYLERDGDGWMEGRIPVQEGKGCVSCHHVPFALWSLREAGKAGVPIPQDRLTDLERRAVDFIAKPDVGRVMTWTPMLLSLGASADAPPTQVPGLSYRESIASAREGGGFWKARGQFPTQKRSHLETDAVATLWTLVALSGADRESAAVAASSKEALDWIRAQEPGQSTEWLLSRLLVEDSTGGKEAAREHIRELLSLQREDGGWSFAPGDPSNAYSTGQALYALRQVGVEVEHGAIARAVRYLVRTQKEDGTWEVPSRYTSHESSSAKDYIYEYWGTAWAVIGLSRAISGIPPRSGA